MSKSTKDAAPGAAAQLHPNQIIRTSQGKKYFGYSPAQLHEKIKNGEIPKPMRLSDTGRASGWTGQQILDHHRLLQERAETRLRDGGIA